MAFLGKVLIILVLVVLVIAAGALCVILISVALDDLKDLGIIKSKDDGSSFFPALNGEGR